MEPRLGSKGSEAGQRREVMMRLGGCGTGGTSDGHTDHWLVCEFHLNVWLESEDAYREKGESASFLVSLRGFSPKTHLASCPTLYSSLLR